VPWTISLSLKLSSKNNVLKNVTRVVSEEPKELKPKSATGKGGAARGPILK